MRTHAGRNAQPSAGILDSQSVKVTDRVGVHGFDRAKKVNGRKWHVLVDTLGLPLVVKVQSGTVADRAGANPLQRICNVEWHKSGIVKQYRLRTP